MGASCGSCGLRDRLEFPLPAGGSSPTDRALSVRGPSGAVLLELPRSSAAGLRGAGLKKLITCAIGLEPDTKLALHADNRVLDDDEPLAPLWRGKGAPDVRIVMELPWCSELPVLYADFVKEVSQTELAIPVAPLERLQFQLDVHCAGQPAFSAKRRADGSLQISLHSSEGPGMPLATLTHDCELRSEDGEVLGSIADHVDGKYIFQRGGCQMLLLDPDWEARQIAMLSMAEGSVVDHAAVTRRLDGALPEEHYQVMVEPAVDSVLILACFFGLVLLRLAPLPGGNAWIRADEF